MTTSGLGGGGVGTTAGGGAGAGTGTGVLAGVVTGAAGAFAIGGFVGEGVVGCTVPAFSAGAVLLVAGGGVGLGGGGKVSGTAAGSVFLSCKRYSIIDAPTIIAMANPLSPSAYFNHERWPRLISTSSLLGAVWRVRSAWLGTFSAGSLGCVASKAAKKGSGSSSRNLA